jgi:hypothetical protein
MIDVIYTLKEFWNLTDTMTIAETEDTRWCSVRRERKFTFP